VDRPDLNSLRNLLRDCSPPILWRNLRRIRGGSRPNDTVIRFEGRYTSWQEAEAKCGGYDAPLILEKVLDATLKVKRGEAVFERDSVLFDEIQYSWPVTAALLWAAAQAGGTLDILDFGGSLGSNFFQNRKFLAQLPRVSWTVVEQARFVQIGRERIGDGKLTFQPDISSACSHRPPTAILASSVLQYLSEPLIVLAELARTQAPVIILDRTPFANDAASRITIQHVPATIYAASYPCWFLDRDELVQRMTSWNYRLVEAFDALDKLSAEATWQGLIFARN